MNLIIKFIFVINFVLLVITLHSQTLVHGKNTFIYSSQKYNNKYLLQELSKTNDSTLIVKSIIITLKDSFFIEKLKNFKVDSLLKNTDTSTGIQSKTNFVIENFKVSMRNDIPSNSLILSLENNILIADFYDNLISDEDDIIFDMPELKAIRRDSFNTIAEFKLPYGFLGFNNYIFLKDFWVIKYDYYRYESDNFILINYNGNVFYSEKYMDRLQNLPHKH